MEVKHVSFNPMTHTIFTSPLSDICKREEKDGWTLERVIPVHQYEMVAVFVRSNSASASASASAPEEKEDVNLLLVNAVWKMLDEVEGASSFVMEVVKNGIKSWQSYEGHVGRNGY